MFCLIFIMPLFGYSVDTIPRYGSNNGKHISIDGTKIYYEEYGRGATLLLLHGAFASITNFQTIIPGLSKTFRVIAIDLPGHGRSQRLDITSWQTQANYCSKFIDLLKLDSVYVYGFSNGGIIALHLIAARPDKVKKAIVHAAAYRMNGYFEKNAAFLSGVTTEMASEMKWWLDDYLAKSPDKDKWKDYVADTRRLFGTPVLVSEQKLQQIKVPVLIMQGDQDAIKIEHALEMHRLIKLSQFCVMPAASHFALLEKPDLIEKIIVDFLTKEPKLFSF